MRGWLSFGVLFEKMVKDVEQGQHMLSIATELSVPDIIDNHVPDFIDTVLLAYQIAGKSYSGNFWQMFMFRDGKNLLLGQAAERDAVFKRDHSRTLTFWVLERLQGRG